MSSKTRKALRKKGKTKKYKGGSNGSNRSVKPKINTSMISLYFKEINPDDFEDELKVGDHYYFNLGRYLYNGKYKETKGGYPIFTDTYNLDEESGIESQIESKKVNKYNGDVPAKDKIYKFAIHPRSKLPSEVIRMIDSMTKVNHTSR
jgi:hypothetical protein